MAFRDYAVLAPGCKISLWLPRDHPCITGFSLSEQLNILPIKPKYSKTFIEIEKGDEKIALLYCLVLHKFFKQLFFIEI